jgi:ornithine cyclodeaminase/alanine dehydrogenase-like protein (mu-crystallin family)
VRTAAVSTVATERRTKPNASVLGIIGSGVQVRSHLDALRLVRDFREIRVWSPRRSTEFAREHGVHAATSAEEVVSGTKPGRRSTEEVTLFKSLGLAVEDVATAELIYRKALDEGPSTHSRS